MIQKGDRVHWVDDPNRLGTVKAVSELTRRDHKGVLHPELPNMVFVEWDENPRWEPPELLRVVADD